MKRLLAGVAVGLTMGTFALVGCSKSEAPAAGGGGAAVQPPQKVVPPSERVEPKLSEDAMKEIIRMVPESAWPGMPGAAQVQAYAKAHPELPRASSSQGGPAGAPAQ